MKCDKKDELSANPFDPDSPNVIICEGLHESNFICKLLEHSGIHNCDVTYSRTGQDGIPSVIELLSGRSDITGILVLRDADDLPLDSFNKVARPLQDHFIAPDAPFEIAKKKRGKSAVFLNPGKNRTGSFEHLLLDAIELFDPHSLTCIESFAACCGSIGGWPANEQAKMRLACYIATHCAKNPTCSPAYAFADKYKLLDIACPVFDEVRQFLVNFAS